MNESFLNKDQQIRSEALEQATRIAVKHNKSPNDHAELAVKLAKRMVIYIETGQ